MSVEKNLNKIWINEKLYQQIIKEAERHYPQETGGVLMGYVAENNEIMITDIINSGPKGRHELCLFCPDYNYQEKRVASVYNKSRRVITYLGDWHTHPNGNSILSKKDKNVLYNIADFPQARLKCPVMIVLSGSKKIWGIKAWLLKERRICKVKIKREIIEVNIKIYKN